jgi:hypothetical protein
MYIQYDSDGDIFAYSQFQIPFSEEVDVAAEDIVRHTNGKLYFKDKIPQDTPEEIAERELALAKNVRSAAVDKITVTVDGMVFDGNEKAQDRMSRAVTANSSLGGTLDSTIQWVLADGTVGNPTLKQLSTALLLAQQEQARLWVIPYTKE